MKLSILALASAYTASASNLGERKAPRVRGTPEGFGRGTTGGGNALCIVPSSTTQLRTWLTDSTPRCIVLDKEFNFKGTEGSTKARGCCPSSNKCGAKGQDAINGDKWCENGNSGPGSTPVEVTYDNAAITAIKIGSNKSIIGVGNKGVLRGKGLRISNGAKNIIIQNIHITDLNPQYIWGGDAITLDGTDLVWVDILTHSTDHCKISLIGRQMFVAGFGASNRVRISNTEFDGRSPWSSSCNGCHYWAMLLLGGGDLITLKGNYIHDTSGRSPKVGGNTLLHAVNNYFHRNTGHAFEIDAGGKVLAEGNVFQNVTAPLSANKGQLFSSPSAAANTACRAHLGKNCQLNTFESSGPFAGAQKGFLPTFHSKSIAPAAVASANIATTAGVGKI